VLTQSAGAPAAGSTGFSDECRRRGLHESRLRRLSVPPGKIVIVPVLSTEMIDPTFGFRHSEMFVCGGRLCRVQVFDQPDLMEPRLLNQPLGGGEHDLPEIGLGEAFQINGQPGAFTAKRVGDTDALVIERVA